MMPNRFLLSVPAAFLALVFLLGCASDMMARPVQPILSFPPLSAMSEAIGQGRYGRVEAVLVEQSGERIHEAYFGKSGPESRIDVRSAGKSITALAVGAAIDDGLLPGTQLLVWDYITDGAPVANDGPEKRAITISDLLSMGSALECNDWVKSSPGQEERMYRTTNWQEFALNLPIDPAYVRRGDGQGRFSYCTAGVFLLGRVVEKAAGMPFDAYVQARLFDPLGITGAEWRRSRSGEVQSGGQIRLRAGDLAKLGRLVLNGGAQNGVQLISQDFLRDMLTARIGSGPDTAYGYLWWFANFTSPEEQPTGGAFMLGNGGNMAVLLPEYDAVVVILTTNYNQETAFDRSRELVESFVLPAIQPIQSSTKGAS